MTHDPSAGGGPLLTPIPGWPGLIEDADGTPRWAELSDWLRSERDAGVTIYPSDEHLLAALQRTSLDQVRVVILGQDPYPNPGEAHGFAFSVQHGVKAPRSLGKIFEALDQTHDEKPTHGCLLSWADQGVLLLNATLTVPQGQAGHREHRQRWAPFTTEVLRMIKEKDDPVVFLLWGRKAQSGAGTVCSPHYRLCASHPAARGRHNTFVAAKPFEKAKHLLAHHGGTIDWKLPLDCRCS